MFRRVCAASTLKMYLGWRETPRCFMRHFVSNQQNVAAGLRPALL